MKLDPEKIPAWLRDKKIATESTDPKVLHELARRTPYSDVKLKIIENPNTSLGTLVDLVEDPDPKVRDAALEKVKERFPEEYDGARALYLLNM